MPLASSSAHQKGVVVTVPVLVLAVSVAAIFLFFLLSSLSTCNCPAPSFSASSSSTSDAVHSDEGRERTSATKEDIDWVKDQIQSNGLHMQDNVLRKGINPRTRAQQLQDLIQ